MYKADSHNYQVEPIFQTVFRRRIEYPMPVISEISILHSASGERLLPRKKVHYETTRNSNLLEGASLDASL
jgi:hypothetical protein